MKETGIVMTGDHPAKILAGTKTMTRRVINVDVPSDASLYLSDGYLSAIHPKNFKGWFYVTDKKGRKIKCPYGQVGDRLWVRETYVPYKPELKDRRMCTYKADLDKATADNITWKSSRFMFKWAARIWLEITGVRVERLQEITEEDALAEGIKIMQGTWQAMGRDSETGKPILLGEPQPYTARYHFEALWDDLNMGRGYGWSTNPWVWVISFRRPQDARG